MEGTIQFLVLVLSAVLQLHSASSQDLKSIFNCVDSIDEGYAAAKLESKPIMLIVHMNYCGACKQLKPKLRDSQTVRAYSEKFIVVNAVDGLDPKAEKIGPRYYPRIMYFASNGKLLPVTSNNRKYRYYYETAEEVYTSMQQAEKLSQKEKY